MVQNVQYVLTRIGARCNERAIHSMNAALNYLEVGRWFHDRSLTPRRRLLDQRSIFDLVAPEIADRQVLYLEFGVFQGASIRYWSKALRNHKSLIHGFDSFMGLPEKWTIADVKGAFSTQGQMPTIDDSRVAFFKGWFDDTLSKYVVPEHEVLFINIDADLYSSTRTILNTLRTHIKSGVYLYFDEFSDRLHELKAFDEFLEETGLRCTTVATNRTLANVLFLMT